jgi:uncharacterized protein YbjT (DUF2867 family)
MKVGFIGLGRMGQAMARRLIDGGHEVGVYNRTADKVKAADRAGAKAMASIKAAATFGDAVFTMLTDDAAVTDVVEQARRLEGLAAEGGVHICAGTHSVAGIGKLKRLHGDAGQVLIATPMLGRPKSSPPARPAWCSAARKERRALAGRCSRRSRGAAYRGRRRSGRRRRDQDRQQFRARLRHRGDGRGLCAGAQIRRRAGRFYGVMTDGAVRLLGVQDLRQDSSPTRNAICRPASAR